MGTQYLMDTNVVIEFLGGTLPDSSNSWLQDVIEQDLQYLSVINQMELLGFNAPAQEMQTLNDFIDCSKILPLDTPVVNQTILLRKNLKIKLPDAIIAATALIYNLTLLSRNIKDFKNIDGLNVLNPAEF